MLLQAAGRPWCSCMGSVDHLAAPGLNLAHSTRSATPGTESLLLIIAGTEKATNHMTPGTTVFRWQKMFVRLLDHLEVDKAHIVGYSMGAKIANSFRTRHPDRLISLVLGGYGWPWQSPPVSLHEARANMENRTVLPGNDLDALAAYQAGVRRTKSLSGRPAR